MQVTLEDEKSSQHTLTASNQTYQTTTASKHPSTMSNVFDPNNPHHYATTKIVHGFTADPAALQKSMQYWHMKQDQLRASQQAQAQAQVQAQAAQPASVGQHWAAYGHAPQYSALTNMIQNPQGRAAQHAQQMALQRAAASGQNAA